MFLNYVIQLPQPDDSFLQAEALCSLIIFNQKIYESEYLREVNMLHEGLPEHSNEHNNIMARSVREGLI